MSYEVVNDGKALRFANRRPERPAVGVKEELEAYLETLTSEVASASRKLARAQQLEELLPLEPGGDAKAKRDWIITFTKTYQSETNSYKFVGLKPKGSKLWYITGNPIAHNRRGGATWGQLLEFILNSEKDPIATIKTIKLLKNKGEFLVSDGE